MEVVRDGGADRLTRCLANMPDKQAVVVIAIASLGQSTSYLERALDTGLSLTTCRRAGNGAEWAYEKSSSYQKRRRHSHFSRRGARGIS